MNMLEMVKERGKTLFLQNIEREYYQMSPVHKERLDVLKNFYQDLVAISEIPDTLFYAAARAAKACVAVAKDDSVPTEELTKAFYGVYVTADTISHKNAHFENDDQKKAKKALQTEIRQNETNINEEGYEVINLVHSMPKEDLTIEGKRAKGLLPADFDSTIDNEEDYETEEGEFLIAKFITDDNGDIILFCPECNSRQLFLEMSIGSCMDCGCDFEIPLGLGDKLIEQNECEVSDETASEKNPLLFSGGIVKRLSADDAKRKRGIITEGEE